MKDIIAVTEKNGENQELLTMENIEKSAMAEIIKVSNTNDLRSKHS